MKLYVVIEENKGYYDEPDNYVIKAICTSPEAVGNLGISNSFQKDVSVVTVEEEHLNKRIDISLNSFFGFSGEEVKINSYASFLKENNIELKKSKNKI